MLAARDEGLGWEALTEMVAAGLQEYYGESAPVPGRVGRQTSDLPNSRLPTRTFIGLLYVVRRRLGIAGAR